MAPDQVQARKLCLQKLSGDSGSPPETLFQGARTLCNKNNFKWLDAVCFN